MTGDKIKELLEKFKQVEIPLAYNSKVRFNHYETIKRINYYINDKYLDRDDGAIFWNIATPLIPHFAKNIDLDTKDLQPYGVGEVNFFQTWVLKMKFYAWLKENHFAIKLNDLSEGLATYGSLLWKKCYDEDGEIELEEVDFNRVFFDTSVENIEDSDVIELHDLTVSELLEKDTWDNVPKVIKDLRKNKKDCAEIWEFWGDESSDEKVEYTHTIGYGYGNDSIILFEEKTSEDDFPYYDFHLGRYRGRWLRMGVVERLFQLQERCNALVNQNAKTTEIASLLLLRSREANMVGNVLEQAQTGQIVNSEDLQQIVLQNPGMQGFISELNLITQQAHRLCMTPDVIMGDTLPSGTPFRSMAALTNAAKTAFKSIRDSVGETISWILIDDIFPAIVKDWNKGELFEIAGDDEDISIFTDQLKKIYRWETFKTNMLNGIPMDATQLEGLDLSVDEMMKTATPKIEIPPNFFNFKFGIRTNITGEEYDKQAKNDAYSNAIQMVSQNPALMNTPLFKQYLEENGISWWKLTPQEIQDIQSGVTGVKGVSPMGGSLAQGAPPTEMMTA